MKVQPAVRKETIRVGAGCAMLSALMLGVFALLGRLDVTVWLGALLGYAAAVGNFFLMALGVQRAAERMEGVTLPPVEDDDADDDGEAAPAPEIPEVAQAKRRMQLSYTGRMLGLAALAAIAFAAPCFHPIPVAISLLFPRLVITAVGLWDARKSAVNP